jgi:hypothetical protein
MKGRNMLLKRSKLENIIYLLLLKKRIVCRQVKKKLLRKKRKLYVAKEIKVGEHNILAFVEDELKKEVIILFYKII